jgi:predicted acyltransferase
VWSYVDTILLSTWHYHAEGILSLIPSFSTVLLGQLAGQWLRSEKTNEQKVNGLFVLGNVSLCVGLILDQWFPINKLLWSSSYVLFTAGFAMNILAIVYWMIEIHGWTRWFLPMVALGMNAIAAFFLSSLTARILGLVSVGTVGPDGVAAKISLKGWLYSTLFSPWLSAVNASLAYAVCYALLWTGLMWILYKKKIFIKL